MLSRRALLGSLVALTALRDQASADSQPKSLPLVELFTSQGCSSCPPADAVLETYAGRSDVVALSLPVDYWDYLGWKDTLASPKFSKRQREYARQRGDGQVYTPQMVINGGDHTVGSNKAAVDSLIRAAAKRPSSVRIGFPASSEPTAVQIEAVVDGLAPASAGAGPSGTIWLVMLRSRVEVEIGRGENRGRRVAYFNVVRDLMPIGLLTASTVRLKLDRGAILSGEADRCAVIVQQGKGGPVLAAAWMP